MSLFKKEVSVDDLIAKMKELTDEDKAKIMSALSTQTSTEQPDEEAKPTEGENKPTEEATAEEPKGQEGEEAPATEETAEPAEAPQEGKEATEEAPMETPEEAPMENSTESQAEAPIEKEAVEADDAKFSALSESVAKLQETVANLVEAFEKRPFGAGGGTPPIDEDNGNYVGPHEKAYFNRKK